MPIALLFRYSLNRFVPGKFMVEALTAENYVKFVTDPFYIAVLARTLRVAGVCMLLCLVAGFPLAYWLARTRVRWKSLLIMLVVLPLFVGNAVRAAGWMVMFGSKGVVNTVLGALGLIAAPIQLMYTETAVIIGITAVNLPFMVLTLQAVIEGIDPALEEAALSLGAGPLATFRRVIWPLAMPGILAGTILTFILGMNAYATPVLLGGPALPDDGTGRLRPVRRPQQLAVRGRPRLRPDDGHARPHRGVERAGPAPLPALTTLAASAPSHRIRIGQRGTADSEYSGAARVFRRDRPGLHRPHTA